MVHKIQVFTAATDFPASILPVIQKYDQLTYYDNSYEQIFDTRGIDFGSEDESEDNRTYAMKEKVAEDLKNLAAMEITKARAGQFVKEAADVGWDDAIEKFNKLYRPDAVKNLPVESANDLQPFELNDIAGLSRISRWPSAARGRAGTSCGSRATASGPSPARPSRHSGSRRCPMPT